MENGNTAVLEETREVNRLRDLKVGVRDLIMLPPLSIEIEPGHNPRDYTLPENRAHLDSLKEQIKQDGIRQPLWVRFEPQTKRAVLVDGECRLRSVWELLVEGHQIEAVPVVQVKGGNEAERLLTALSANTGKPLSTWESGKAFTRLIGFGWSAESIAKRMGYSLRFVNEAVELADAPQEVKQLLSEQAVTPALALKEMRTNGAGAVESLKAAASQARAEGKKTATKKQENPVPNASAILKVIADMVEGMEDDLFNPEFQWVEVPRAAMVKLARFVGVTEEKGKGKK